MQISNGEQDDGGAGSALDEAALGRRWPTCRSARAAPSTVRAARSGIRRRRPPCRSCSSGAVSPSALARPMIVPVRMPGMASGTTWWVTVCIFEAPTPRAASRIDGGTAPMAARVAMMMVGSVISVSTRPPTMRSGTRQAGEVDEDGEAEKAEDDRRHGGEVVDVDLDEVGQQVLGREFLQVDRGGDAERHRQQQHGEHHEQRADHGDADAGRLRMARSAVGEQAGVELLGQRAGRRRACRSRRAAGRRPCASASGRLRSIWPLIRRVDVGRWPARQIVTVLPMSDGIGQHRLADLRRRRRATAARRSRASAACSPGRRRAAMPARSWPAADSRRSISAVDRSPLAVGIDHRSVENRRRASTTTARTPCSPSTTMLANRMAQERRGRTEMAAMP